MYLNWVVHCLTLLGLLCRFHSLTSVLLFVGFLLHLPGHYACDSERSPGTWAVTQWKTTIHVIWIPPSCQHRHGWTRRRNKLDFLTTSDFTKCPHLRATDKRYSSHKLSSFRCSNLPGKTDIRTRARRKSKWTTGGYGALCRCGCSRRGKGTQFHCLNFAWGRLASRPYAATATTFLMKMYGYCVCDSEWFPFFSNVWLLMIFFFLFEN